MKKIRVGQIVFDEWNINHIKKHKVTPKEVKQVLKSTTETLKAHKQRLMVLGRTKKRKLLSLVLAPEKKGKYYLVTARPMSKKERRYFYAKENA